MIDELALLNGLELGVEKEGTIVKGKENMVFSDSLYHGTTREQPTAVLLLCAYTHTHTLCFQAKPSHVTIIQLFLFY